MPAFKKNNAGNRSVAQEAEQYDALNMYIPMCVGFRYFVKYIDDSSGFAMEFLLKKNSEVFGKLKEFEV